VPESALKGGTIEIYLGDIVRIGDFIGRFSGYDINSANWSFVDRLTRNPIKCPTVGKLNNLIIPIVTRENIVE